MILFFKMVYRYRNIESITCLTFFSLISLSCFIPLFTERIAFGIGEKIPFLVISSAGATAGTRMPTFAASSAARTRVFAPTGFATSKTYFGKRGSRCSGVISPDRRFFRRDTFMRLVFLQLKIASNVSLMLLIYAEVLKNSVFFRLFAKFIRSSSVHYLGEVNQRLLPS